MKKIEKAQLKHEKELAKLQRDLEAEEAKQQSLLKSDDLSKATASEKKIVDLKARTETTRKKLEQLDEQRTEEIRASGAKRINAITKETNEVQEAYDKCERLRVRLSAFVNLLEGAQLGDIGLLIDPEIDGDLRDLTDDEFESRLALLAAVIGETEEALRVVRGYGHSAVEEMRSLASERAEIEKGFEIEAERERLTQPRPMNRQEVADKYGGFDPRDFNDRGQQINPDSGKYPEIDPTAAQPRKRAKTPGIDEDEEDRSVVYQ